MKSVQNSDHASLATVDSPQVIFQTELDAHALLQIVDDAALMSELRAHSYGVALAVREFSAAMATVVHRFNQHNLTLVAWLLLPPAEGTWSNLQNYPQTIERYRAFRAWAEEYGLQFAAVGLDIEPPSGTMATLQNWSGREVLRHLWLARENVLYPAALAAYRDLIAAIRHDGYEVHTFQVPLLADDRRAGTTVLQRALDIIDLPADVEVLTCYSSMSIEQFHNDLGGALIAAYGPAADAIAVGSVAGDGWDADDADVLPSLDWNALRRDLILAAQYSDTIYVASLEGCVTRGWVERISRLNWTEEPAVALRYRIVIGVVRWILLITLLGARFRRGLFAWLGWLMAALLLVRQLRQRR